MHILFICPLVFAMQSPAGEQWESHKRQAQDSIDSLADKLVDAFFDSALKLPFVHLSTPDIWLRRTRRPGRRGEASRADVKMASELLVVEEWQGAWTRERIERFRDEIWERRPLLVKGAFLPNEMPDVSGEKLLDLACTEELGSATRLIVDERELTHGPFYASDLNGKRRLARQWSVLCNDLERHTDGATEEHRMSDGIGEEVRRFKQRFFDNIVPDWRHDDVMASVAHQLSGIGAHIDSYDVFLVQGKGRRRWSIEARLVSSDEEWTRNIADGRQVRVLSDFKPSHSWELEEGDFLYLPPRIPHEGVALMNGTVTISVGFRAPSSKKLTGDFVANALLGAAEDDSTFPEIFMTGGLLGNTSGEIAEADIDAARELAKTTLLDLLEDRELFARWFGSHVTLPNRGNAEHFMPNDFEPMEQDDAREWLQGLASSSADEVHHTGLLCPARGIKWAYTIRRPDLAYAFADGEEFRCMGEGADDTVRRLVGLFSSQNPRMTGPELIELVRRRPAAIDFLVALLEADVISRCEI